ncbi:hypothetical protein C6P46_003150, partial [Rhodotorula mucilaginosa]
MSAFNDVLFLSAYAGCQLTYLYLFSAGTGNAMGKQGGPEEHNNGAFPPSLEKGYPGAVASGAGASTAPHLVDVTMLIENVLDLCMIAKLVLLSRLQEADVNLLAVAIRSELLARADLTVRWASLVYNHHLD